jgi:DNA polymerase III alpha subunit
MIQTDYGELIYNQTDIIDLVMQGQDLDRLNGMIVDSSVSLASWPDHCDPPGFAKQQMHACSVAEWHAKCQDQWLMPDEYKTMDIAAHVLSLCESEAELQRCGHELLMYQERNLFELLKYLKYLVDVMQTNHIIWGVGRGSSVSSYVLYKLKVHRMDSLYYNLDIAEFLR